MHVRDERWTTIGRRRDYHMCKPNGDVKQRINTTKSFSTQMATPSACSHSARHLQVNCSIYQQFSSHAVSRLLRPAAGVQLATFRPIPPQKRVLAFAQHVSGISYLYVLVRQYISWMRTKQRYKNYGTQSSLTSLFVSLPTQNRLQIFILYAIAPILKLNHHGQPSLIGFL
jgi:hypothetical protein